MDYLIGNESVNLGRYSIRSQNNSDIQVGSFWRRKRITDSCQRSNQENVVAIPKAKRFATPNKVYESSYRSGGSVTSQSTRSDSEHAATSSQWVVDCRASDKSLNQALNLVVSNCKPIRGIEPTKKTGDTQKSLEWDKSSAFIIDTQRSSSFELPLPNQGGSPVSLCVDINPSFIRTDSDTTEFSSIRESECLRWSQPDTSQVLPVTRPKTYPKQLPYNQIMADFTFVFSGLENPRRSKLRDLAIKMGAKYKAKWDRSCTHLICAFKNTPKYKEVMAENGRIVREHWIQECSRQRQLLDWRNYKLGKYPYPDSEEEE